MTAEPAASSPVSRARGALLLILVLAVNLGLVWHFHDRSWIPSDDGHYAHVASRLVEGQVLNRDVEELHPGYVHFIHAWSLKAFGQEMVSLRYPLMAGVVLQSLLVFALFLPLGAWPAVAAALGMTAIGPFQIANPTTSLYSLFFTVALAAHLSRSRPDQRGRYLWAGVLLGVVFFFRQLSGVFVGMGVVTFFLLERREAVPGSRLLARLALALVLGGLLAYLAGSTEWSGTVVLGLIPLALLGWGLLRPQLDNRGVLRLSAGLATGVVLAATPLVAYHLIHGSLAYWINDAFLRAFHVAGLEHIRVGRYYHLYLPGFFNIFKGGSLDARINGLYWTVLPLAAAGAGCMLLARVRELRDGLPPRLALPVIAVFYAMVSVFNQIPFYLYLSAGLSLVALLWLVALDRPRAGRVAAWGMLSLAAVGLVYQAGQPYTRAFPAVIEGMRVTLAPSDLPRHGLAIDPGELRRYRELLEVIDQESDPGEVIFTFPNNADLYFLADRKNAFRLFNPTLSLVTERELLEFFDEFERAAPALVIKDGASAYNTTMTDNLFAGIRDRYVQIAVIGKFEVYRRVAPAHAALPRPR